MEFGLPNTHKSMVMYTCNPRLWREGQRDNQILEAHWSANLAESMSFPFIQWDTLSPRHKDGEWSKKDTWCWPQATYGTNMHMYTYSHYKVHILWTKKHTTDILNIPQIQPHIYTKYTTHTQRNFKRPFEMLDLKNSEYSIIKIT